NGQGDPGIDRTLGDTLTARTPEGYGELRARIEAATGLPCDGWCVPRGTGDPATEGTLHGQIAAQFDNFYLNTEWGWPGFWTCPNDVDAIKAYLTAFWEAAGERLAGKVLMTWVPNSMLTAASDDAKRAWIDGTNGDVLELYVPDDPNLDPYLGVAKWQKELERLGIDFPWRPIVPMVEHGPLTDYIRDLSDPTHGVHLWTLESTHDYFVGLPDPEPTPVEEPVPVRETPSDFPFPDWRQSAIAYRGALDAMGRQLADEQARAAELAEQLTRYQRAGKDDWKQPS
ncbi:MAG: hypothetical protein NUW22_06240, partial [Acidobacteria bacterium]|nr:hypothetical protein [Acidobacteriota bacterium]